MAKLVINDSTLTAIGNAIREKTGKTDLIAPGTMPAEIAAIETGGSIEVEPIVLSGNCQYTCVGAIAGKYIELFGDTISTKDITDTSYMFQKNNTQEIPFEINCKQGTNINANYMFSGMNNVKSIAKINNMKIQAGVQMFSGCNQLRTLPEFVNVDFSSLHTGAYANMSYFFNGCFSLRSIPEDFLKELYNAASGAGTYVLTMSGFNGCYVLNEIRGISPQGNKAFTSNIFSNTFNRCGRLKDIIFDTQEDGTPYVALWKNQIITTYSTIQSSSYYIGTNKNLNEVIDYNSGIAADKEVTDDATYQALKNDPDWFTLDVAYSRYNHDSAVNTINSLPDTSAYLAANGGTNTIQFYGASGEKTDGGAINTLTEEEIAVAAAKGWTVTLV